MSEQVGLRGKAWLQALTGQNSPLKGDPGSVLTADATLGDNTARYFCVVPNPDARFPCARRGEVGLEESYTLATRLREAIEQDKNGKKTAAVLLLETGGVRLQEANLGLAVIAEVMASILALREHAPVITVIAGTVGCFGGMSIAAGLSSYIVMTVEARLGLNGPEVIEQESGIEEFDSSDKALIWAINGGEQRVGMGVADELVLDDAEKIAASVQHYVKAGLPKVHRSKQVELYRERIAALDTSQQIDPLTLRKSWNSKTNQGGAR